MQGVTAALTGFIFVCVIFPHLIKHSAQFYAPVALVLLIIIFAPLSDVAFFRVLLGLLQAVAIIVFILAAGGLSARELAGEFTNAYQVIRRGEDKPIIVPIAGQQSPKTDEGRVVYEA